MNQAFSLLSKCLKENEFDIVGLANFPDDNGLLNRCLGNLASWLADGKTDPVTEYDDVLYALVRVAQEHYGQDDSGYWRHLETRLATARKTLHFPLTGVMHSLIGEWFRRGLKRFGYPSPRSGHIHQAPILWHAGCPRHVLQKVLPFVMNCVEQYGEAALEPDALIDLQLGIQAKNWTPQLPRAVVRLLNDSPDGAGILWQRLATVAHIYRHQGEDAARDSWEDMPGIQFDDLLDAFPLEKSTAASATGQPRRPRWRYDPHTGEVRLWLVDGRRDDWEVDGLTLRWEGTSAVLLQPPPPKCELVHLPTGRKWCETVWLQQDCPAIWFTWPIGALERGSAVEGRGLEAGPWYLLAKGYDCDPKQRRSLTWTYLQGGEGWAAWEVEVPEVHSNRMWTLQLPGKTLQIQLARRSGPRLRLAEPAVAMAQVPDGTRVALYTSAPVVAAAKQNMKIRLLRRHGSSAELTQTVPVLHGQNLRLPAQEPGLYQVREARGRGSILLDFAVISELTIAGPRIENGIASVDVKTKPNAGCLNGAEVQVITPGCCRVSQSAVEPWLSANWSWPDKNEIDLRLSWPVQTARWRISGLSEELQLWTQKMLVVDRRQIRSANPALEVQVPHGQQVKVNGHLIADDQFQRTPSGDSVVVALLGYTSAEAIHLLLGDTEYRAVCLTERPFLKELHARIEADQLCLTWSADHIPTTTQVAVWDPCDPASDPITFPLDQTAQLTSKWCSKMEWHPRENRGALSVTLAVKVGGGFGRVRQDLLPAFDHNHNPLVALASDPKADRGTLAWIRLTHCWSVALRFGGRVDQCPGLKLNQWLADAAMVLPCSLVWNFLQGLQRIKSTGHPDGRQRLGSDLYTIFNLYAVPQAIQEINGAENPTAVVIDWLTRDIHPGWQAVAEYCQVKPNDTTYPLGYFRDLWMLNSDQPVDERHAAAKRILAFHNDLDLYHPNEGLPLTRVQTSESPKLWFTDKTKEGHTHWFCPTQQNADDLDDMFYCQVGVKKYSLKLLAEYKDQFHTTDRPPGIDATKVQPKQLIVAGAMQYNLPTDYNLGWLPENQFWKIDRFKWNQPVYRPNSCCSSKTTVPLLSSPWTSEELTSQLRVREWLIEQSKSVQVPEGLAIPEAFDSYLFRQSDLGELHRSIVETPRLVRHFLFGKDLGLRPEREDNVPQAGKAAWRIAWIDRLAAWEENPNAVFTAPDRDAFFGVLRLALMTPGDWGKLLKSCLALAEYMLHILRQRGLGPALRFAPSTESSP